jgi:glycosyltransferase involved in cell wall biosynthesis
VSEVGRGKWRILVVAPFALRIDAPHGGKVTGSFIRRLAEKHSVGVVCLRREDDPPSDASIVERCEFVEEVMWPVVDESPWSTHLRRLGKLLGGRPDLVARASVPEFEWRLASLVRSWQPDLVQVETHEMAQYLSALESCSAPRILVDHDPGASAAMEASSTARGLRRFSKMLDSLAWRRYSRATMPGFDSIVVFTERDRRAIEPYAPDVPIAVVPFAIEIPERPLDPVGAQPPRLLFFGGFEHPPNADAASRLISSIFPRVREREPSAVLQLVGTKPTPEMLAAANEDVVVSGGVPSLVPYLDRAALVVVPIRRGGGMRVKVLEALAAGKAVVASPRAVEGLNVVDGRDLVVAETDEEFVSAISELIDSEERRVTLAGYSRRWAETSLGRNSTVEAYEDLYRGLLSDEE